MDLRQLSLRHLGSLLAGGTKSFTSGGIAKGTAAGSVKTVNTVTYEIDGILYSKAATDSVALTGAAFTASGGVASVVEYLGTLDISGNITMTRSAVGADVPTTVGFTGSGASGTYSASSAPLVAAQNGVLSPQAPFCIIKVSVASGTTFTPGTTNVDAAGVTTTFYNVSGIPSLGNTGL